MNNLPPILLTSSALAMDRSVQLKDQNLRIFHTIESIKKWLAIWPEGEFVLCDGSGYDFSALIKSKFPDSKVECLFFKNDPNLIDLHGKGFGEGEIIKYALEHSIFLRKSNYFAKCTAKLWVENFFECLQEWNEIFLCQAYFSNVFSLRKTSLEYIDTRFYVTDKRFYLNNLSSVHFGLSKSVGIEDKFLHITQEMSLQNFLFPTPPEVRGMGGGSGKYYKNSKIKRLKERIRSKMVSLNSRYKRLFSGSH